MKSFNTAKAFLAIFLVVVFCSVNIYAKNPVKDTKYPTHAKQIRKALEQTVKFPDCGMTFNGQGIADVVFSVKEDGKIKINEITANCKDLEVYLKEQLKEVDLADIKHPEGQHYKATFIFCYN